MTTGSPADARPGALGQRGTNVLLGGKIDPDTFSGARFTVGFWLDNQQCLGLEGSGFWLGERTFHFAAGSNGDTILARPYNDVSLTTRAGENRELVSAPGQLAGTVAVDAPLHFYGSDIDLRWNLWRGCWDGSRKGSRLGAAAEPGTWHRCGR